MYQVSREKRWYLQTWFSVSFPSYTCSTRQRLIYTFTEYCKVEGVYSLSYLDFVNIPSSYNLEYFHKLVVENGGSFSMNLNDSVTHCIAAEKKGIYLFKSPPLSLTIGYWNTCRLNGICILTFRYQVSSSHASGKDHSLWLDIGLLQGKTSSSFAT